MIYIRMEDHYNHPELYRFMPQNIFQALEEAYLNGIPWVLVSERQYITMVHLTILSNGIQNN